MTTETLTPAPVPVSRGNRKQARRNTLIGWTFIVGALAPLALAFRPRSAAFQAAFAAVIVVVSIQLFADRDVAPIFGHLSPLAGQQHR